MGTREERKGENHLENARGTGNLEWGPGDGREGLLRSGWDSVPPFLWGEMEEMGLQPERL